MIPPREHLAAGQTVLDHRLTSEGATEHRVAVLSAALLRAVMNTYGDGPAGFAARAGLAVEVVVTAVDGTRPAWALPYDEFAALAEAVVALWPSAAFEIATACDLLLTSVLNGDQFMATDVLTDSSSQALAQALLGAAADGLPEGLQALLRERAADLAASDSPDAWVGTEILTGCLGRQS